MPGPREMKCNSLRNKKVTKLIVSQLKQLAEASQASFGKVQVQSVTYGDSHTSHLHSILQFTKVEVK